MGGGLDLENDIVFSITKNLQGGEGPSPLAPLCNAYTQLYVVCGNNKTNRIFCCDVLLLKWAVAEEKIGTIYVTIVL